jgi:DNA-binding LacI/PurR family transcriptional regulator
MSSPGLKQIAEIVGVSTATVSDVLNGKAVKKRISPATAERVIQTAKKLNYRPNLLAKSLVKSQSHTIGLMFQDLSYSAAETVTAAVFPQIEKEGYTAFISTSQWSAVRERREIDAFIDRQIEGVIAVPLTTNREFYRSLIPTIPLVQICDWLEGVKLPSVVLDAGAAIHELVAHLHQLGHRKIGFIGVQSDSLQLRGRYEGFLQSCADFGISMDRHLVEFGRNTDAQSVCEAGLHMLASKSAPTAIIGISDPVAIQLMEGLLGTRYSGTVAIAGIGDSPGCASRLIQLTSVSEPLAEIGKIAAQMLMAILDGREIAEQQVVVKGTLIPRLSTLEHSPQTNSGK